MPPKYPNVTVKLSGKAGRAIITAVGQALKAEVDTVRVDRMDPRGVRAEPYRAAPAGPGLGPG